MSISQKAFICSKSTLETLDMKYVQIWRIKTPDRTHLILFSSVCIGDFEQAVAWDYSGILRLKKPSFEVVLHGSWFGKFKKFSGIHFRLSPFLLLWEGL